MRWFSGRALREHKLNGTVQQMPAPLTRPPRAPRPRRGRPPDPGKRRAILRAATRLFLRNGFAGTSVEAVAGAAGVSKLTVYSHFGDKERLFQAVVRARCDAYNQPENLERFLALPAREGLVRVGRNFLALLLDPEVLRFHRVMVSEAARRPRIAELFFAAGPERHSAFLADFLRRGTALGHYDIRDPEHATEHLQSLLKGMLHFRATLSLRPRPGAREREAHVERVVDVFLRAYGRPEKGRT
jgi:TetR/AcrR family transcriptional repressor of mexJK operon